MILNSRLGEILRERGISQTKLAEMTGINYASLHGYIKGKWGCPEEKILWIAKALKIPAEDLVDEDEDEEEAVLQVTHSDITRIVQVLCSHLENEFAGRIVEVVKVEVNKYLSTDTLAEEIRKLPPDKIEVVKKLINAMNA